MTYCLLRRFLNTKLNQGDIMSILKDPKVVEKIEAERAKAKAEAEVKGRKEAEKEFKAKSKQVTEAIKGTAAGVKAAITDKALAKEVAELFKKLLADVKSI
jgi:hypothetical protein